MLLKQNKTIIFIALVVNIFFPFIVKADDPWAGLKDISINNKEDSTKYCGASGVSDNISMLRCDVTVYDPKGASTQFQFDAIKKTYSDFILVDDKRLDMDVKLKLNYTPGKEDYSLNGTNFFIKEKGADKTEYGEAACKIITHCCCSFTKDAAGNFTTEIDTKNCKQTFCDCKDPHKKDISFCGTAPKAVPINGTNTDIINCGLKKCTKTDKACSSDSECKVYSENGICKNSFCFLDDVGLKKYKEGATTETATEQPKELKIVKPTLEINIPQLNFSDVENNIDSEGFLHLPYIGEYMKGIYNVAMVVISIVGVIMIIVVGVKITVMGGQERVNGFKKIGQIVIGLFIAWGSYSILYTINPGLVNFDVLKVKYIEKTNMTTGENTDSDAKVGDYQFKYFKECPVQLSNPFFEPKPNSTLEIIPNRPRRLEYHEKILASNKITGTLGERIVKAAEAAAQCKLQYENCGVNTTIVYTISTIAPKGAAAFQDNKCLRYDGTKKEGKKNIPKVPGTKICNSLDYSSDYYKMKSVYNVADAKTSYGPSVRSLLAGFMCSSVKECGKDVVWPDECIKDKETGYNKLKGILEATGKFRADAIDLLQPGDYIMTVNWNSSCWATHSQMFMGWVGDKSNRVFITSKGDAYRFYDIVERKFDEKNIIISIGRPTE